MRTLEVFLCPKRGIVYLDSECGDWFFVTSDDIGMFARTKDEEPYAYVGEVKKDKMKEMLFLLTLLEQKNMLGG